MLDHNDPQVQTPAMHAHVRAYRVCPYIETSTVEIDLGDFSSIVTATCEIPSFIEPICTMKAIIELVCATRARAIFA